MGTARMAALLPPTPPVLLAPADDPEQDHCFLPDPQQGIRLSWREEPGSHLAAYVEIRHYDPVRETWVPWVKAYAHPPFTLLARPSVYNSVFAWRVWAVDRSGRAKPYARPSEWRLFCTLPRPRK